MVLRPEDGRGCPQDARSQDARPVLGTRGPEDGGAHPGTPRPEDGRASIPGTRRPQDGRRRPQDAGLSSGLKGPS